MFRVLEKDIPRTRNKEPEMQNQNFRNVLRRITTFYCQQNQVSYQQGLLEVVYPFARLRNRDFPTKNCYAYFNAFMRKYFPKVLIQRNINSRKQLPHAIVAFNLAQCLLRFHYPRIYHILQEEEILFSLVAAQEIMTIFAKNLQLPYVYIIYDYYIGRKDPLHLFFMLIALLGRIQLQLEEAALEGNVQAKLKTIKKFQSENQLQQWFKLSEEIQSQTPQFFLKLCSQFGFTNRNILTEQQIINMLKSQNFLPGSILPINLKDIDRDINRYVLILRKGTINDKYSSMNVTEVEKMLTDGNSLDITKIYVLAANGTEYESETKQLIEFSQKLTYVKVCLLKEKLVKMKTQCEIF